MSGITANVVTEATGVSMTASQFMSWSLFRAGGRGLWCVLWIRKVDFWLYMYASVYACEKLKSRGGVQNPSLA